jgi:hypothetical protein
MGMFGKVVSLVLAAVVPGGLVLLAAVLFGQEFRRLWLAHSAQAWPVRLRASVRGVSFREVWRASRRRF